ncbi:MAG TPA: protein translocase subunit SecF [Candidatus Limnocylindrales bacterium]|nr:protein translocase subunit SecF [Candidatus Limnocylindrales bacterium]
MEFFGQANIKWMEKAKYFFALSGFLLLVGFTAMFRNGGLTYGIDFKGGTLVTVRFAQPPNVDSIRHDLEAQGLGQSTIQSIRDVTNPNSNEIVIGLEEKGQGEGALDAGKTTIIKALSQSFPSGEPGKQDFNSESITTKGIADYLVSKDPLSLGLAAGGRYTQIAQQIVAYRTSKGIITDIGDLGNSGAPPQVVAALRAGFYPGPFAIGGAEIVGPKVGAELRRQAVLVTLYALAGMLVYIAIRFEWIYGVAAVVAVFHDVLITLGLFSLFHQYFEISLTVIAALLTLVGYSMNDTIVIFDRVRENNRLMRREPLAEIVNRSINQTLSRTILTSGLTFLTVAVLFVMGGPALRSFSFALVIGIVVGTYSSFGIAAPLVVGWNNFRGGRGSKVAVSSGSAAGIKPGTAKRVPA